MESNSKLACLASYWPLLKGNKLKLWFQTEYGSTINRIRQLRTILSGEAQSLCVLRGQGKRKILLLIAPASQWGTDNAGIQRDIHELASVFSASVANHQHVGGGGGRTRHHKTLKIFQKVLFSSARFTLSFLLVTFMSLNAIFFSIPWHILPCFSLISEWIRQGKEIASK